MYRSPAQTVPDGDLLLLQEVSTGDLPNWDAGFAVRGYTRAVYAMDPHSAGAGDGQAIYYRNTTVTLNAVYSHELSNGVLGWDNATPVDRAIAVADVTIVGQRFLAVDVHLCHSKCADSQADVETTGYSATRVAQIGEMLGWLDATFPGVRRIIGGDFNLTPTFLKRDAAGNPSGYQIDLLKAAHTELWSTGIAAGTAHTDWPDRDNDGQPDMTVTEPRTADKRQIDFFFASTNSNWQVGRISILDSRAVCPHALVNDGGSLPSCSPEVVKQWDIREDYGARPTDHNLLELVMSFL